MKSIHDSLALTTIQNGYPTHWFVISVLFSEISLIQYLAVLSKFRPEIDEEGKAKTFEIAKGLLRQIPEVKRAAVGPPINDGMARGYDYGELRLPSHNST